jgi:hypothetical protein
MLRFNFAKYFLGTSLFFVLSSVQAQVTIDNKLRGDGRFSVEVSNGGDSNTGFLDPNGIPAIRDVIFKYSHYIDVGASGSGIELSNTTISTRAFLSGTGQVSSSGEFTGENGKIQWTAVSTIVEGQDIYSTKLVFKSERPFGRAKFIQYFDEDVDGENDDQLVVIGQPASREFQLLTVDAQENVGVAQGAYFTDLVNMNYVGWAADEYPVLENRIESSSNAPTYTIAGVVNTIALKPKSDSRYPGLPVYGTEDITTAMAFDLNPTATFSSATVYIGSSRDGKPIIITPPEALKSPVHTKYNTFLSQYNYLELISAGNKSIDVTVKVYSIEGKELSSSLVPLAARAQQDIDINGILVRACKNRPDLCSNLKDIDGNGVPDTYGLIRLEFEDNDPDKRLLGRISHYKQEPDTRNLSYSFAFARELTNPLRGASYSSSNTFDAQGTGNVVPNWVEIINLDPVRSKDFIYNLFSEDGLPIFSRKFTLPPLGEWDVQAGHEILNAAGKVKESVYSVEVVPTDPDAEYLMYVSRYSAKSSHNVSSYNYAFSLEGRNGTNESVFAPITAQDKPEVCALANNWVEVINVLSSNVNARAIFRDSAGNIVKDHNFVLEPKKQFHFNASLLIPKGDNGTVEVSSREPKGLIAQSLVYYHDCDRNQLQTAYISPLQKRGSSVLAGTANTFIDMDNVFKIYTTVSSSVSVLYSVSSLDGRRFTDQLVVNNKRVLDVDLKNTASIGVPANSYGILGMSTGRAGDVAGQLLRIRKEKSSGKDRIDFVMPTIIR